MGSREDSRGSQRPAGGFVRWLRSRRVVVDEESMTPALLPGDRLLYDPGEYRDRSPAPGEIVVVTDPEAPRELLIKRVGDSPLPLPPGAVWLVGDARDRSRDSRHFGPVALRSVRGRAWLRYAPPQRRARL
ncbi:MAG TPA: S26 family signal peptidase [Thermoplasmata archaeon]|nr:S26 family signal peptidase [Thermoplasmata archaeon]